MYQLTFQFIVSGKNKNIVSSLSVVQTIIINVCLNVFIIRQILLQILIFHRLFQNKANLSILNCVWLLNRVKTIEKTLLGSPKGGHGC